MVWLRMRRVAWCACMALLSVQAAHAYSTTIWDFRTAGSVATNTGFSYGNVRTFTENVNAPTVETVAVTAWANTGAAPPSDGSIETAYLGRYSTGIGVCNRGEGSINYCDGNNPLHQADNVSQSDLVMFRMDQGTYEFNNIVIDPYGEWDRDVTFWIGNAPLGADLTGLGINDLVSVLGFTEYSDYNSASSAPLTIDLMGNEGNTLIFGPLYPPNGKADRFKIKSLTATLVPIPAAVWLFGSALAGMVAFSRRRR